MPDLVFNDSVFLNKQLSFMKKEVYKDLRTPLGWRKGFRADTTTWEWADTARIKRGIGTGSATRGNRVYTTEKSEIEYNETPVNITGVHTTYHIHRHDLATARSLGINLESESATNAREVVETDMNNIIFYGDSQASIVGLFDNGDIAKSQVALNGDSSSRAWADKTGQEIIDDVYDEVASFPRPFMPNKIATSYSNMITAKRKKIGTATNESAYDDITGRLKLTWVLMEECDSVSLSPMSGADTFVVWDDRYPYVELPMDIKQLPNIEEHALYYEVTVMLRTGGLVNPRPKCMRIAYGI